MKTLLLSCLIAIAFAAELSVNASATQTQTKRAEDISLMKSTDVAYSEALAFAAILRQQGFGVTSIHRSKLEGFFQGVNKAAFFRIGKGVIEMILFPDAEAARQIKVNMTREGQRYVYTFRGQPQPRQSGDTMNSAYPMYFITHGNAFIVTNNSELAIALTTNLAGLNKQ
ncbi:MAG: hypothetical protein ABJA18_10575 [bacterium]